MRKWEVENLQTIRRDETHEEYMNRQLIGQGRRDAIAAIWRERDRLVRKAQTEDQENEEKEANLKGTL